MSLSPAILSPRERLKPGDWEGHRELVAAQLTKVDMARNEFGYDPFGARPEDVIGFFTLAAWLYDHYFRVMVSGLENVPDSGGALLIANHAGMVPTDGMMIAAACLMDRDPPRFARGMAEFWFADQPFLGTLVSRMGSAIGTRGNCQKQLTHGDMVMVFPEGARGMHKTFDKAYQLQNFGLGFLRMALEAKVPIVPVAVVGSEEQNPGILDSPVLSKIMGLPHFPITPFFPLLGPLGLLPMPVRYRIYFGKPRFFEGDPEDDDTIIKEQVKLVEGDILAAFDQGKKERESIFG